MHNPDSSVVVLVDEFTNKNLIHSNLEYKKYSPEIKVVDVPDRLTQKEYSRWIKTSMRQHIVGDFLYLDCDTIIADNLEYNFPDSVIIGAIRDCHMPLKNHHYYRQFRDENLRLGFRSILETDAYFNGGVIFCRNAPESYAFFERWHSLWKETLSKGNSQDMPSFNRANHELCNIISEIGGEWNCQIGNNGLLFLYRAKIIHYFATSLFFMESPFIFASEDVLASIKETGKISNELYENLKNPKTAFELNSRIISDMDVLGILDSSFFSVLRRFVKKNKKTFELVDSFIYRMTLFLKRRGVKNSKL
jgi:hypothetical protein